MGEMNKNPEVDDDGIEEEPTGSAAGQATDEPTADTRASPIGDSDNPHLVLGGLMLGGTVEPPSQQRPFRDPSTVRVHGPLDGMLVETFPNLGQRRARRSNPDGSAYDDNIELPEDLHIIDGKSWASDADLAAVRAAIEKAGSLPRHPTNLPLHIFPMPNEFGGPSYSRQMYLREQRASLLASPTTPWWHFVAEPTRDDRKHVLLRKGFVPLGDSDEIVLEDVQAHPTLKSAALIILRFNECLLVMRDEYRSAADSFDFGMARLRATVRWMNGDGPKLVSDHDLVADLLSLRERINRATTGFDELCDCLLELLAQRNDEGELIDVGQTVTIFNLKLEQYDVASMLGEESLTLELP